MLQSLLRHRRMFLNPRYGVIGMVVLPYYLLFEALGPLIEGVGYLTVIVGAVTGLLNGAFFVKFFLVAVLVGVFLSVASVFLEEISFRRYPSWNDLLRLMLFGLLENAGYRQILAVFKLQAYWEFVVGRRRWGRMDRRSFEPHALLDSPQR